MKLVENTTRLVAYSRAGDIFHYRWAARRCLKLIQPNSNLESVFIEGSQERKKAGEYVIDVSEYYDIPGLNRRIEYYQLKHTTVRHEEPFTLSGLKDTIVGFSKRFQQHANEKSLEGVSFTIITNRKIGWSFKQNLDKIVNNEDVNKTFKATIKKYTNLADKDLICFCGLLKLEDSEGNYNIQKQDLRIEMARLQPGSIDSAQVDSIVALVQEKVLPHSNGKIIKEEIWIPFGVTSEKQLFPAPPLFEESINITIRSKYNSLIEIITKADYPVIIHAEGGVGKSVFSQHVIQELPEGSIGIAYDCFGSGKYRSRSEPRHRHRDALVQIVNELASMGLCDRMLVQNSTQENDIMQGFLNRIKQSINSLKQIVDSARLFILIDAADNAEMAAQEFGDSCFASELLREKFPKDCNVVLLCRTERIQLLKPPSFISQLNLPPFSKEETFKNLLKWFPNVSESESFEFHRLTSGNPRVQMNSIAAHQASVNKLLDYLGPSGTTVEKQIEQQLNTAVNNIKDALPKDYQSSVSRICTGLASLPPNIPIQVLSRVSDVQIEDVKSFVADIGRSLWLLDSSVQFRDEPTETWFRKTFLGAKEDFNGYIKIMEPLAGQLTYVAEVLPQLYLQAGQYDQLINTALSDELLPLNNPIDTRNVRVYRLQFAFKAALRLKQYKDAIKLALRAGEEVAGDQRQQNLFLNNIDLLPMLQDKSKVQEIAFKGLLKSSWEGSENLYTASLLSGIQEYKGEASGYLRSALNWLQIYFEELKQKKDEKHREGVSFDDILEIALVHLNLSGARSCLKFLNSLKPRESIFLVMKRLVNRLIDAGRFNEIDEILKYSRKNKFYVVAIVSELGKISRFTTSDNIEKCLDSLSNRNSRIKKPNDPLHDNITPSILAFLEVCLHREMEHKAILEVLDYYVPNEASQGLEARYDSKGRIIFLKALSIRKVISGGDSTVNLDEIIPKIYLSEEKKRDYADKIKEFKEVIGSLVPWFLLRAQVISGNIDNLLQKAEQAGEDSKKAIAVRYKSYDTLPNEIAEVSASILVYCSQEDSKIILQYYNTYILNNSSFKISERISLLCAGYRVTHLNSILPSLENSTYELIKGLKDVGPDEIASNYISLARAVLYGSKDDASTYFEEAINIVSKFGDEIVARWEAVVSLSEQSIQKSSDELAYRFIRCTELVGEYVYREKHWDRSGAIITCTRMSHQIGISALSRWRDRGIGRFEYQLESLLKEIVQTNLISPAVGWSITRFFSDHQLNDFLSTCLANEASEKLRIDILNDAYQLLCKEGANPDYWGQLKSISVKHQINDEGLNSVVDFHKSNVKSFNKSSTNEIKRDRTKTELKKLDSIYNGLNIATPEGFLTLLERFSYETRKEENGHHHCNVIDLFQEALNQIEAEEIYDFIGLLLSSEKLNYYECEKVLSSIPDAWKNKVSFKKKWPVIINRFGQRYAHELVNEYSFNSVVQGLGVDGSLIAEFKKGIFYGLSQGQEFADARMLFDFVRLASTFVNASEASELTDYALSRFEIHIEDDFGDGPWDKWLHVSNDINKNIAGFIWSALGSPQSKTRWNACHAVKKLADFNCNEILNSLIEWLEHDKVDAFGSIQFPFYNLHARQYLLIALCRLSVDHSSLLVRHKKIFLKYSQFESHILIQKLSAEIALNIEKAIPGTYTNTKISFLNRIGKSKHERREVEYDYRTDSYWHTKGAVDTELDFHFGWDFDRYWYEPLGEVFGVPGKQIQDLCANVIFKKWELGTNSGYNNDPRVILWNQSRDRETWHDHSGYPKTDNLDFYLSYHSMLVVAAQLVEKMPVLISKDGWDDDEDKWDSWLSRHFLTREDSKWLADCRDPLPLMRPEWLYEKKNESWRTDILERDFLNCIKIEGDKENWINVRGGWTEKHNSRYETYSVSSALVSIDTSDALLRALSTCSDPNDYKIPDYEESNMEINSGLFQLMGWISNPYSSKGIDELDPYADNIDYPPFSVGHSYLKELDLFSEIEGKTWCFSDGQIALKCKTWSRYRNNENETPDQYGMRLSASLTLLKKLCKVNDCNLIIKVNIRRDFEYEYRKDKYEYFKPKNRIYLLSADGRLKSTEKSYRLR